MEFTSSTSDRIRLRRASADDFSFLFSLHAATLKEYIDQTWGWDESLQRARYRETFDPGDTQIITLQAEDIGMLAVEEREADIFLSLIEIDPEHQGHGIGTAIIRDLISDGIRRGKPVFLHVLKVNPAKDLYERLGFSIVEETPTHYYMRTTVPGRGTDNG